MGNCFPQSLSCSGGKAEEMAGAKITGTAFVFLNSCPCLPRPGAMLFCSSLPVSSKHLASQGDPGQLSSK